MAIRLSGSLTRKMPIPGVEFSSQSFSAGMEVEVNSGDPAVVVAELNKLYRTLSRAIDEQVAAPQNVKALSASTLVRQEAGFSTPNPAPSNGNGKHHAAGNSNGRYSHRPAAPATGRAGSATPAQQKAVFAICKSLGLDMQQVLADYNVTAVEELGIRDASRLIDDLKARQNGNGSHPAR